MQLRMESPFWKYRICTACPETAETKSPKTHFLGYEDIPSNSVCLLGTMYQRGNDRKAPSAVLKHTAWWKRQVGNIMSFITNRTITELGLRGSHEHCHGSSREGLMEEVTWAKS